MSLSKINNMTEFNYIFGGLGNSNLRYKINLIKLKKRCMKKKKKKIKIKGIIERKENFIIRI